MNNRQRDLTEVADEILYVIRNHSDLLEKQADIIINQIEKVKNSYRYSAPEMIFMRWEELANVLTGYFNPSRSKWETEIMIIFNDLNGTIDDYWEVEDENN